MSSEEKYMRNAISAWEETERALEQIVKEIRSCNYGIAEEKAEALLDMVRIYGKAARNFLKERI